MKILVIIVTVIGFVAVIGSVIVGKMMFDGKVMEHPYEAGLRYDEIQKAKARVRFEILTNKLHRGENDIVFLLTDVYGRPIHDSSIVFIISRASSTLYDRKYRPQVIEPGKFLVRAKFPLYGYWDVKVEFMMDSKNLMVDKRIFIESR